MPTTCVPTLRHLLPELREARFVYGVECVRCQSKNVIRWGRFSGRQRFRCRECRRTFSDLTHTPAAYLKLTHLLPAYRDGMAATLSVRAAARAVGVHPTTSFRWRHRLLAYAGAADDLRLRGIIETAERAVPRTFKGGVPSGERRRRTGARHYDPRGPRLWLIAMCDRHGGSFIEISDGRRPFGADIAEMLAARVTPPAILVTGEGILSRFANGGRRCGMAVWHARSQHPRGANTPLDHGKRATAHLLGFSAWLRRFQGVSAHYLSNYVAWRDLVDPGRCGRSTAHLLYWPLPP